MNKHLNDGQLRAALDGELDADGLTHLKTCQPCQMRQAALRTQVERVAATLAFLASPTEASSLSKPSAAASAWHRFHQQKLLHKETFMFRKLFAAPLIRYGLSVVLILTLILAIPGTRALASEFLNLFRVQQVTVVPVDFTGMEQLNGTVGNNLSQLISQSITMTRAPGDPVKAKDVNEASQLAGFTVRAPQGLTPTQISVMSGAAFTVKVDRAKAQALLDEAGRSDLILPETIDGSQISVNIPASVSVAFGNCPEPSNEGEAQREMKREMTTSGSPGRIYKDCIILAQIPSPEVSAPAGVDVAELAKLGLEFSGMTSEQAAAFTGTVDWTSTLVVPIPKNAASYEQLPVDGVTGTLIQRPVDDAPQFALLWVKNGIVYAVGGLGTNTAQALKIANSLP